MKTTQKQLKELVRRGAAVDLTNAKTLPKNLACVAMSYGIYGMNGGLFKDSAGQLYAVTARCANLFALA